MSVLKNIAIGGGILIGGFVLIKMVSSATASGAASANTPTPEPTTLFTCASTPAAQSAGLNLGGSDLSSSLSALSSMINAGQASNAALAASQADMQKSISAGANNVALTTAQSQIQSGVIATLLKGHSGLAAGQTLGFNYDTQGHVTSASLIQDLAAPKGAAQVRTAQGLVTIIPNAAIKNSKLVTVPGTAFNTVSPTAVINPPYKSGGVVKATGASVTGK